MLRMLSYAQPWSMEGLHGPSTHLANRGDVASPDWFKASQKGKKSHFLFSFSLMRESWDFSSQRLKPV
eukprot:2480230-Ditylum_brightwellii.AAC.1